jgi:hypothetical protein
MSKVIKKAKNNLLKTWTLIISGVLNVITLVAGTGSCTPVPTPVYGAPASIAKYEISSKVPGTPFNAPATDLTKPLPIDNNLCEGKINKNIDIKVNK